MMLGSSLKSSSLSSTSFFWRWFPRVRLEGYPERVRSSASTNDWLKYTHGMAELPSKRRDRQVVRILGILGALCEGGQPTVRSLAFRFGTRRETIYRDLRALEDAGYPISGDESGRLSHPRLLPEARRYAPHLMLSDEEITGLQWASQQAAGRSPFPEALRTATAKLCAMAREDRAAGIKAVMVEGGWGKKDYALHRQTILLLVEAILRNWRCEVVYQPPAAAAAKSYKYDPYRIVSVAGGLYCLGKVPPHQNLTTLAVDRLRALEITEVKFEMDPSFDAEQYRPVHS
jgi:predicted DNA-binding transcriptional regulator YafY